MPVTQTGERTLRIEPLWARVDRNRLKPSVFVVAFVSGSAVLLAGAFLTAEQLANAEEWVRNRFNGRPPKDGEAADIARALAEMSLAAGLPVPPSLLVLDVSTVNAFALGTTGIGLPSA